MAEPTVDVQSVRQEIARKAGVEDSKVEATAAVMQRAFEQRKGRGALETMKEGGLPNGVSESARDTAFNQNIHSSRPDITTLRGEVNDGINSANKLLKNYDTLHAGDKAALIDTVRGQLASTDWLSDLYGGLVDNDGKPDLSKQRALAESFLQDNNFRAIVNKNLHDITTTRIDDETKKTRAAELKAKNPSLSDNDALNQAAGQLENEWVNRSKNILQNSLIEYMGDNIDAAIDVTTSRAGEVDAEMERVAAEKGRKAEENVAQKYQRKWSEGNAYSRKRWYKRSSVDGQVIQDYTNFINGGLEKMFGGGDPAKYTEEEKIILNDPQLRAKYEAQFGGQIVFNFLSTGKGLPQDHVRAMMNAPWLGANPEERIKKLTSIVQTNGKVKQFMDAGMQDGSIDKTFWQKYATMDTAKKAGVIAAIIAALAIPGAGAATAVGAAAAAGKFAMR